MKTISQIKEKASALKRSLAGKPIVENFGEKQMRALDDYVGDIYDYPYSKRMVIIIITGDFFDWCVNYTGK